MLRRLLLVIALVLASAPLAAQIRTIGGGSTCCSAATITPIDSIRFTGTTSAILGGAGNMTILAGTGSSRSLTFQTTNGSSVAQNSLALLGGNNGIARFNNDVTWFLGNSAADTASVSSNGGVSDFSTTGNMVVSAGYSSNAAAAAQASKTITFQTTTAGTALKNTLVLGADSSVALLSGGSLLFDGAGGNTFVRNTSGADTINFNVAGIQNIKLGGSRVQMGTGGSVADPAIRFNQSGFVYGLTVTNSAGSGRDTLSLVNNAARSFGSIGDTLVAFGKMKAGSLTAASGTPNTVCINATTKEITENAATSCVVSSRRFKQNILPLTDVVAQRITTQLKPSVFKYRVGGRNAIGLIAEEADSVDSRLATRDGQGRINSVNYEQVTVVLLKQVQTLTAKLDRMCRAGVREAC